MQKAFEHADDSYLMLADGDGRFSLWPSGAAVPDGWTVVLSTVGRLQVLDSVEKQWPELRPVTMAKRGLFAA